MKTVVLACFCCVILLASACSSTSGKKPADRAKVDVGTRGEIKIDVRNPETDTQPTPDKTGLYEHRHDSNPLKDTAIGVKGSLKF